jgi:hypothetical protein
MTDREDPSEWMTIDRMAAILTPQQAAHVLARTSMLRLASVQDEYTDRLDRMLAENPGHRMFEYCLRAVARRA